MVGSVGQYIIMIDQATRRGNLDRYGGYTKMSVMKPIIKFCEVDSELLGVGYL